MNPLVFILAYLLLAGLAVFPELVGQNYPLLWAALGSCGALMLQSVWTIQALAFSSKLLTGKQQAKYMTVARVVVLVLLLCVGFVALYNGHLKAHLAVGAPLATVVKVISSVCEGGAVVLFFSMFWIAARGICEVEEKGKGKGKVPAHRVVGTFLLFVYLVIGAPFIFGRLKKLSAQ